MTLGEGEGLFPDLTEAHGTLSSSMICFVVVVVALFVCLFFCSKGNLAYRFIFHHENMPT